MSVLDVCIYVLLCVHHVIGAATSTPCTRTSTSDLTCPFRTVNYLTHTLHQQCLPSIRVTGTKLSETSNIKISQPISSIATSSPVNIPPTAESSTSTHAPSSVSIDLPSSTISISPSSSVLTTSIESVTTVAATPLADSHPIAIIPDTADDESALENGSFLSFEDWKKQNLIKAGQSEHLGKNNRVGSKEPRKRPANFDNSLDSLGDDAEIDLDFSGLVHGTPDIAVDHRYKDGEVGQQTTKSELNVKAKSKRKEPGTTSKERFNFASFDCAASVLKTNPEAKSANTVLSENKDSYMLNKCSANNKFIILELCEDIQIDTIVLANFEFFSSSFRTFRVSLSENYPVKIDKWKTLGTFEARNTREVQAFLVENPIIWARYIRIEFLTHYGHEFYCPVSLIRVHGTTMLQEYKHDQYSNLEDDEDESDSTEILNSSEDSLVAKATDHVLLAEEHESTISDTQQSTAIPKIHSTPQTAEDCRLCMSAINETRSSDNDTSMNEVSAVYEVLLTPDTEVCLLDGHPVACTHAISSETSVGTGSATLISEASSHTTDHAVTDDIPRSESASISNRSSTSQSTTNSPVGHKHTQNATLPSINNINSKKTSSSASQHSRTESSSKEVSKSHTTKQSGSSTQSQPPSPTIQESFFKSVQKRLQMLEANSSLSLQYIEEQSRALRDAFRKVEQRQFSKTSTFLEQLNQTVLSELREFRQQYNQLWQSTVIELELQRERYERESQAMNTRLGVLADELIFQRRVSILQMILILVCLGLILFSRGGMNNYLELPLVQSVLSRSPSSKWIGLSGDSRTSTPAIPRARSAHQLRSRRGILKAHNRSASEDSNHEVIGAPEMYSPPTPVSYDGYSDAELIKVESKSEDPEYDPINIERPSTSPPVLPSISDPATPTSLNGMNDVSIDSRILTPLSSTEGPYGPEVKIEHPTPSGRHLTWDLPE